MSEIQKAGEVVSFADRYFASPAYEKLFRRGMDLVEDTSSYLNGGNKDEIRTLDSRFYKNESQLLTSRLMAACSWLLAMRAVHEEGVKNSMRIKKARLGLQYPDIRTELDRIISAPRFVDLIRRSHALIDDIRRIDRLFHRE